MTISSLDPSGELGRLFSAVQSKAAVPHDQRQPQHISSASPRDDVALSVFAQEVRDLTKQVLQEPDVRNDRVQAIREALASKSGLASPEEVADALTHDTILNALALS